VTHIFICTFLQNLDKQTVYSFRPYRKPPLNNITYTATNFSNDLELCLQLPWILLCLYIFVLIYFNSYFKSAALDPFMFIHFKMVSAYINVYTCIYIFIVYMHYIYIIYIYIYFSLSEEQCKLTQISTRPSLRNACFIKKLFPILLLLKSCFDCNYT